MAAPTTASCAILSKFVSASTDGPINSMTPKSPIITPVNLAGVICSSDKNIPAISTVNSGVVALIIDASPDAI